MLSFSADIPLYIIDINILAVNVLKVSSSLDLHFHSLSSNLGRIPHSSTPQSLMRPAEQLTWPIPKRLFLTQLIMPHLRLK